MKVTKKLIKGLYKNQIRLGYCELQTLLKYFERKFFTYGIYGWDADIYQINYDTCIITGYRPFGNISVESEIVNKYEEEAKKIDKLQTYDEQKEQAKKLLEKFVDECLNQNK